MHTTMRKTSAVVAIVIANNMVTGCATTMENQQLSDTWDTVVVKSKEGAVIGTRFLHNVFTEGAYKLAQFESKLVRSADEDRRLHGFTPPTNKVFIKLNKGYASPKIIRKGQKTTIYNDYSLSTPSSHGSRAEVTYSWTLKKDGNVLTRSKPVVRTKEAAGHQTVQPINIPTNAAPGTYIVETRLSAGSAYDVNEATFVVR